MKHTTQTVILDRRGAVKLRPVDHLGTGGQGSTYRIGDDVVKVYTDSGFMAREGLVDKIAALMRIKHPYVLAPKGLVQSEKGNPIGFYMPYADAEALSRVITNEFRIASGLGERDALTIIDRMQEVVRFAHSNQMILVDPNEMNWFVGKNATDGYYPLALDVDGWSFGKWRPTAIMPSIRDWHSSTLTERTDWFAWGIVSFMVLTGIHPYKGTLCGYKMGDLEARMKANASVFTPGVRLNKAVRDIARIPRPLLEWFEATFQKGERTIPPSPFATGAPQRGIQSPLHTTRMVGATNEVLIYERVYTAHEDSITHVFPCNVLRLRSGKLIELSTQMVVGVDASPECQVIRVDGGIVWAVRRGTRLHAVYVDMRSRISTILSLPLSVSHILSAENRLFAATERGLSELIVIPSEKPILAIGSTWATLPAATKWFDGVGIEDVDGTFFLVLPFGEKSCTSVRVSELDGLRPIIAKAGPRFVSCIALDKTGKYRKFELTFDREYQSYSLYESMVDTPDQNIVILPKGVCATIVRDGELVLWARGSGTIRTVKDDRIETDMRLSNAGDRVLYFRGGELWSMRLA